MPSSPPPHTPELLSLVLELRPAGLPPAGERPLPAWWGRAAHTLLLAALHSRSPELAARCHDESALRPFSVSTLIGPRAGRGLVAGQPYSLRLTALSAEIASVLLECVQPGGFLAPGGQVELDFLRFDVLAAHVDPAGHPWAAVENYQQLAGRGLFASQPPRRIGLRLSSPTSFRTDGVQQPFPLKELVFGSLLNRWNAFAPVAFPDETRRYVKECLVVSRFKLVTRGIPVKEGGIHVGSVGEAVYTAVTYDRYWMGILNALAAYAFYAGVGASTSIGCGQAAPFPVGTAPNDESEK